MVRKGTHRRRPSGRLMAETGTAPKTVTALAQLMPRLKQQGYTFGFPVR
jgi:hypothetical protein